MNNRNRKNWTITDRGKLRRMYNSGRLTVSQIANRLGRTYFATVKQAERMSVAYSGYCGKPKSNNICRYMW